MAREHNQDAAFSSVAKRCNAGREYEETHSGREEPKKSEFPRKFQEYEETRRTRKLRHRRYWQILATISIYLLPTYRILIRVFSNVRQRYGLSSGDKMENLDVNAAVWKMVSVHHSSSCNSSRERLFRESTFHQQSVHAIVETVVLCN